MAKKVTINGSNIISSLSDAWGGTNNSSSAQTIYGTSVPAGAEWGINRGEVERFVKAQMSSQQAMTGYFTCATAAGTAAKTVVATGYALTTGGCIRIKMNNANTANNVTLNINSTGAKALHYLGSQASSSNSWEAGDVLEVFYDGVKYQCAGWEGDKFSTGEKIRNTAITDEVTPNSDAIITSGAVAAETNSLKASVGYYECNTAAITPAKTVSASGYKLMTGGNIRIKMTNANTAANVTLNINSTGAKALYYDGAQASSTNTWEAGEVLEVYYDGTQYQCASGGGGKFATGEKVKDVSITNQIEDSNDLITSSAVYGLTEQSTIDLSSLTSQVCSLGTDFWYRNGSRGPQRHIALPVVAGEKILLSVTHNTGIEDFKGWYAWCTSSYSPPYSNNQAVPMVASESERIPLLADQDPVLVIAPEDAAYLILTTVDGGGYAVSWTAKRPAKFAFKTGEKLEDVGITDVITENSTDLITSGAVHVVREELDEIKNLLFLEFPIDISGYPSCGGIITFENSFVASSTYYGILVPFNDYQGKQIRFKKNVSADFVRFAFLTGTLSTSSPVPYCSGETQKTIYATEFDTIVPSDCTYIYIYAYSDGVNMRPTVYELEYADIETLNSDVNYLNEKVGDEELDLLVIEKVDGDDIIRSAGLVWTDGTFRVSNEYYGGFINVTAYRGKYVTFKTTRFQGQVRYAFCTSAPTAATSDSILCSGCSLMTTTNISSILIPDDCSYLYVYLYAQGTDVRPNEVIIHDLTTITGLLNYVYEQTEDNAYGEELEMGDYSPSIAELFNYYFPNLSNEQQSTLTGLASATITDDGMTLPALSQITHNKLTVFDDENIILEVYATTSDKVLMYASPDGSLSTSQVASYILFDFANGRVSIYRAESINISTGLGTELCGVDFTIASGNYILTIGRKRRCVFASIYNKDTRERKEIIAIESLYPSVNTAKRPAGWLYEYPSIMTISGTPLYKRFSMTVKNDLFMLFQGDSYTEGYAGFYTKCWAYKAARYFRNSRTCGLSGHKLADIITQYHDSIKGKINVKMMVISIGINDMSDLTTDAKIATWANNFKTYVDELIADGIIPVVNRIWPEGSETSATAQKAEKMNNYIRSWGVAGADFGSVTGYPSNATYYTSSHLSELGNQLTYEIFINELSYFICR